MHSSGSQIVRFGTFELDVPAGELRKEGIRVKLQEQPLRILQMLLAARGRIVTREELRAELWSSNSYVDFDHGLNRAINKLREALGDSAESPRFIETLAKRGYRFVGELGSPAAQIRSLLVLPFDNLSGDPEQEYFAVGLTEALTTQLAKISALRVVSRTTATNYKRLHKTLPEMARELEIDGIIEGSVLRSAGRVRISAQLLHAPTDCHLWADSYDRDMRDILELQTEVASAIVREIRVKMTAQEQTQLQRTPATNADAYDAYLRGRYYWSKRTISGIQQAIQSFEQATSHDPGYAAAYAGLADCYGIRGYYGMAAPAAGCARGKTIALQAIAINKGASEPHCSLAWALQYYDYDFAQAEREYRRSIELDPHYTVAHYWLSMSLAWQGRFEEALAEVRRALALDPLSIPANPFLCMSYLCAREYAKVAEHARRTIALYPDVPTSHWALGIALLEMADYELAIGEFDRAVEYSGGMTLYRAMCAEAHAVAGNRLEAERRLLRLLDNATREYVTPYLIARIHVALAQPDEAFRWLETGWRDRAAWMPFLKVDPRLDTLRGDPRFDDLMRRINYPPPHLY